MNKTMVETTLYKQLEIRFWDFVIVLLSRIQSARMKSSAFEKTMGILSRMFKRANFLLFCFAVLTLVVSSLIFIQGKGKADTPSTDAIEQDVFLVVTLERSGSDLLTIRETFALFRDHSVPPHMILKKLDNKGWQDEGSSPLLASSPLPEELLNSLKEYRLPWDGVALVVFDSGYDSQSLRKATVSLGNELSSLYADTPPGSQIPLTDYHILEASRWETPQEEANPNGSFPVLEVIP